MKCEVLDERVLDFDCSRIIPDWTDSTKFLLVDGVFGGSTFMHKGHVADDQLVIQNERIEFGVQLFCSKLTDSLRFDGMATTKKMTGVLWSTIYARIRHATSTNGLLLDIRSL